MVLFMKNNDTSHFGMLHRKNEVDVIVKFIDVNSNLSYQFRILIWIKNLYQNFLQIISSLQSFFFSHYMYVYLKKWSFKHFGEWSILKF